MSFAVRARDVNTNTLRSDNAECGEVLEDRGTMVVVIFNFGASVRSGETGGTLWALALNAWGDEIDNEGAGIRSLPTPIGRAGLDFREEATTTSVGIGVCGGSRECGFKNAGNRIGNLSGRGEADTCKRAVI
jgi:hypothetical protein